MSMRGDSRSSWNPATRPERESKGPKSRKDNEVRMTDCGGGEGRHAPNPTQSKGQDGRLAMMRTMVEEVDERIGSGCAGRSKATMVPLSAARQCDFGTD